RQSAVRACFRIRFGVPPSGPFWRRAAKRRNSEPHTPTTKSVFLKHAVRLRVCCRLGGMLRCTCSMNRLIQTFSICGLLVFGISIGAAETTPMQNSTNHTETATLGGGCFWCTEALYQMLPGVKSVTSGYAGGTTVNPTYQDVCTGKTGHAEVIQIEFDPAMISYDKILSTFWEAHDPTT